MPGVVLPQGADSAQFLKEAGKIQIVEAAQLSDYTVIPAPAMHLQPDVASATKVPWIDANGWMFIRGTKKGFYKTIPAGSGPLATVEGFAYGAETTVAPDTKDLSEVAKVLKFLSKVPERPGFATMANVGVIDDGSPLTGEVMKLLNRRNLLFKAVSQPDSTLQVNMKLGSAEFPKKEAANPYELAQKVRQKITDDKRLLRIYNSGLVIGYLTGDAKNARLHLIQYGGRSAREIRIRVGGTYAAAKGYIYGSEAKLQDFVARDGGTEFTIPEMSLYTVVDLSESGSASWITGR